ncbi:MAG: hypothetical protein RL190_1706 [Actinomycetota bacterium]
MAVVDDHLEVPLSAFRADPDAYVRRGRAGERFLVVEGGEVLFEVGPPRDRALPAGTVPAVDPIIPEHGSITLADLAAAVEDPDPDFLEWLLESRRAEGSDR